ncbi:ACP S-malonyltransferase [Clostridium sp. D2Q-11]|uniref:Malonyl CoA-acyl carrier protein transacylase n=1 Tax=Anaeromonas frigoriresistens TaxID=2683708 RepID=A0A942V4J0_9FIRM|nr:ACP S-malonyltransferase [Anaeromonas frigoriresistens]MBS4539762.1 ACP S-malonyltransferase [Anaeromonas frigoriresistens]
MKTAFVFPGQGAQYIGMGEEFYNNFKIAQDVFNKSEDILGINMKELCFEGPMEQLSLTEITQPAILTTSYAILKVLEDKGVKADVTAGLSLGEYTALLYAGAIKFEDAVKLVRNRGKYMQEAVPEGDGKMAALIGIDIEGTHRLIKDLRDNGIIEAANYNCPGQIVITGESDVIEKAVALAKEYGAKKAVLLPVSAPFHSSLLKPAGNNLKNDLEDIDITPLNCDVISNVTADYINENEIKDLLIKQVCTSVYWQQSIEKMLNDGVTRFIEIGPGKSLSTFIKKIAKKQKTKVDIINIESIKDLDLLI